MGRRYQDELQELFATSIDTGVGRANLARAVTATSSQPLIVVASGGAQVAARWIAQLHLSAFGRPASVLSPLELLALHTPGDSAIWLVSQGGRHGDIVSAAHWAVEHAPLATYALIGSAESDVARLLDACGGLSCSLGLPAGTDGFLTTNGLWAMLCATTRAYAPFIQLPGDVRSIDFDAGDILHWALSVATAIPEDTLLPTLALVTDPWTAIGAYDLEVRATEAALGQVWSTNYRNLGHGRHFWLADRTGDTTALFLASKGFESLDAWTRNGLPIELKQFAASVPFRGPAAGLASVALSMFLAGRLGRRLARDPGRPGVPAFGERLYAGISAVSVDASHKPTFSERAVAQKLGLPPDSVSEELHGYWFDAWRAFSKRLHGRTIQATVFDFDGTLVFSHHRWGEIPEALAAELRRLLHQGLYLGIATGRGDSVQPVLQRALEGCDLRRVIVGYHNGASVRTLAEFAGDLDGGCHSSALTSAATSLASKLGHIADIKIRANQCSLKPKGPQSLQALWLHVRDVLAQETDGVPLAAWLSSHSVDVCAPGASKLNVIKYLVNILSIKDEAILRLGDRGAWPGNDYDLLNHPCGASVDQCSLEPDRCWNLTGDAGAGPLGVLGILRRLSRDSGNESARFDLGDDV